MIYDAVITIAANTTEANASLTTLRVTQGLIWLLECYFPPGCCDLARFQIFDGSYQVFPATPGAYLAGEGQLLKLDDLYLKQSAPYELTIKCWNLDDTWQHTLSFRLGFAVTRAEMSRYMPALAYEDFEKLMLEMLVKQEDIKRMQTEQLLKEIIGG